MTPTPIDDSQRVVPVDMIRRWSAALDDALKSIGYWGESVSATEMAAIIAAAPAASPPVAPLAAAQEGVRVSCWRYIRPDGSPWKWNDGAPTTAEYENAGDETIELAYSHPPAQTQGG